MTSKFALVLAIGLGIVGAGLNFAFLRKESQNVETVQFVGITDDVEFGELLAPKHLVPVPIPKNQIGSLDEFAVRYNEDNLQAVFNKPAPRLLERGTLLLEHDLKTPPAQLKLGENERAWPIPIDTRVLVPSLIEPGDQIWFLGTTTPAIYPAMPDGEALPEVDGREPATSPPGLLPAAGPSKIIGPFTVLALGNRLGSAGPMKKENVRQVQENVMLVRVTVDRAGNLESPAAELRRLLDETGSRPLGYLLRPRDAEEE